MLVAMFWRFEEYQVSCLALVPVLMLCYLPNMFSFNLSFFCLCGCSSWLTLSTKSPTVFHSFLPLRVVFITLASWQ